MSVKGVGKAVELTPMQIKSQYWTLIGEMINQAKEDVVNEFKSSRNPTILAQQQYDKRTADDFLFGHHSDIFDRLIRNAGYDPMSVKYKIREEIDERIDEIGVKRKGDRKLKRGYTKIIAGRGDSGYNNKRRGKGSKVDRKSG